MNSHADQLRTFLAGSDVSCPGCGYNLHGSASDRCGECGARIVLTIARGTAIGGQWWFFIFAFGWVWIATFYNLIKQVKWMWQLSLSPTYQPPMTNLGTRSMAPTLSEHHTWSNIPLADDAAFAFWGVLLLACSAWLVVLIARRQSAWSDRARRHLIGWVFALSAAFWASRTYFMIRDMVL